ncbi:MAG: hypothetical protein WD046_05775 [Paracoccaceae bacterium]
MTAPQANLHPTRSALRLATMRSPGRKRRYALRLLWVATAFGLLGGLVWLVHSRLFAPDGAIRPLYWLHDNIYLPLYGRMWTALFPYAMLWLIPLLLLIALLLWEYLLPRSPLRALHRWLVRTLITLPFGQKLVALLRSGFSRRVVDEYLTQGMGELMLLRNAVTSVPNAKLGYLARLVALRWHLSAKAPRDELALFESTALLRMRSKPPYTPLKPLLSVLAKLPNSASMAKDFALLLAEDSNAQTTAAAYRFMARLSTPPEHLADVTEAPLDFAALAMRVALLGAEGKSAVGGMFFTAWARGMSDRLRPTLASRLHEAQSYIHFEFWAALSDHSGTVISFDDAYAHISPRVTPERGEYFAWRGEA